MAALTGFIPLFVAIPVFAAEISLETKSTEIAAGQQFQINLLLDTEGEEINAVEGKIVFPNILELKEIRDGNSIINFWIEKPKKQNNAIVFSGITPGGFTGNSSLLFSVVFEAKKEGRGLIEIQNAKTLINDGKGTPAETKISSFQFNIKEVGLPKELQLPEIKDVEPPESFVPEIARDESIFEGKCFLVFVTQDKASGIDHYEIKESRQRILSVFGKWVTTESPYVLHDQELRSFIFVKAVDKNGNKIIIKIAPRNPLLWYKNYENWIIIVGVLVAAVISRLVRSKIKYQKSK